MQGAQQGGFTLVEVMIVTANIGVLATVAVPFYRDYVVRTQVSEGLTMAAASADAVTQTFMEDGRWPTDNAAAGIAEPDDIDGLYVESIAVVDGSLRVTFGRQANAAIQGRTLELDPELDNAGDVTWNCGDAAPPAQQVARAMSVAADATDSTQTIDAKYLPDACRS